MITIRFNTFLRTIDVPLATHKYESYIHCREMFNLTRNAVSKSIVRYPYTYVQQNLYLVRHVNFNVAVIKLERGKILEKA